MCVLTKPSRGLLRRLCASPSRRSRCGGAEFGPRAIGRSRAVRPARRRSRRSGQAGRRQGRGRCRAPPTSPPRSNSARPPRRRRAGRCISSAVPTPPTGKCRRRSRAWRKAADKGSTSAMVELGVLYGTGAGVARDEAQARKLFERAAEAGNPRGVTNLAALSGGGAASTDRRGRGSCWQDPPRPMPRRSISSA